MTTVYFATNRNKLRSGKFGQRFKSDGPHFYVVGRAEVTWNRVGANGEVLDWDDFEVSWELAREQRPRAQDITGIPEMHVKEEVGSRLGSTEIFREVRAKMKEDGRDAIIFIHDFANDFESSIGRAAQLAETYTISREAAAPPYKPYVFAFSWPSNGKVFPPWEYASDRNDAALSGLAMARALRRFVDFLNESERCKGRLHLVCHSMGNWALRHAVLGLRSLFEGQRLPKLFDNSFLMAADEDEDCFEDENKLKLLPELARRIHVYRSGSDLALEVSDKTKFNMDRVGTDGPRTFSGISNRIVALDCTDVNFTEMGHGRHQYYRLRPEVIEDVRHVLSGRVPLDRFPRRQPVEPGRRYRIPPYDENR
jgi:esterase/lipase superfamily enzyme